MEQFADNMWSLLKGLLAIAIALAVCMLILWIGENVFRPQHFAPLRTVEVNGQKFAVVPAAPPVDPHILSAKTIAEKLVAELDYDPQGWRADNYEMHYKDGTKIWIGNQEYGLDVTAPGGGTIWGVDVDEPAGKNAVYRATQRWAERKLQP